MRRDLLARTDARERFAAAAYQPATLADLQRASAKAGIPVLLYGSRPPTLWCGSIPPLRATADQFRECFGLPAPCRFVLVVDQAEELYTWARKAEARWGTGHAPTGAHA